MAMGWLFFWAGITKILNPDWTAESFLKGAKAFSGLYEFFLSPEILPIVNILNAWGLTLIGVSLILGVFLRISAVLGMILMVLYYLPLGFPHPNPNAYIVDQHLIYILGLGILASFEAGSFWSLGKRGY